MPTGQASLATTRERPSQSSGWAGTTSRALSRCGGFLAFVSFTWGAIRSRERSLLSELPSLKE